MNMGHLQQLLKLEADILVLSMEMLFLPRWQLNGSLMYGIKIRHYM